ncbi:quaternary ammonium compound-resistance protein SugE [Stutzerimonas stutzeri]|uniref:Guanidinium exporter n=1 Tax=Stutzerimonas stutzeri TaxID=316 RepID=A0A2S4ANE7_STUST|nr:quaternary ammonium compound efflux SMR transporter SugE [Stutzerimonas stutzeri]MCQ4265093.1 quaternary ammonium compound efflux SMR transporter SugE [Stutzerimonas stutzeri]POH83011.1 quaternary ammonium compound-resistance protein SugE [Stutzerimonas stutzeri]
MHSAWIMLTIAGLLEVGWAIGLKASEGFTRPLPSALTIVAMAGSFFLLARAMQVLPVGTAYAIWVGIGALGTVALGILIFGESASTARLLSVVLLLAGLVGLKLTA